MTPGVEGEPSGPTRRRAKASAGPVHRSDIDEQARSRLAGKPSPTDRLESALGRHIESLDEERRRLIQACDETRRDLEGRLHSLQGRLDWYIPAYAGAVEILDGVRVSNLISAFLITGGGVIVSMGGYYPDAQRVIAWTGAAFVASGLLVLVVTTVRGWSRVYGQGMPPAPKTAP